MEFGDNMSFTPPFNSIVFFKSRLLRTKLWVLKLCFFFYFNVVQVCRKMKRKKNGVGGGGGPCVLELCVENPRFFVFEGNYGD
jgi:hypothetical protein